MKLVEPTNLENNNFKVVSVKVKPSHVKDVKPDRLHFFGNSLSKF